MYAPYFQSGKSLREAVPQPVVSDVHESYESDQISENRFCRDREDHEQHDAAHRHSRNAKEGMEEKEEQGHARQTHQPDRGFVAIHGLNDMEQDHESDNRHQYRAGCRDIYRAHIEDFSEYNQARNDNKIGERSRHCLQQDIAHVSSVDQGVIRNL